MELTASWIWLDAAPNHYNQAVEFTRALHLDEKPHAARLRYSADTVARVWVNGHWIADGPCRGWSHAYHYDQIDLAPWLQAGRNDIRVVVRFFGCGTFHQIPQRGGLIAQIDLQNSPTSKWQCALQTDESWQAASYDALKTETPKICIQMGPMEWLDGRVQSGIPQKAHVLFGAAQGPWGKLRSRDVALPGRFSIPCSAPKGGQVVKRSENPTWAVPVTQLSHPGISLTPIHASRSVGLATLAHVSKPTTLTWNNPEWRLLIAGRECQGTLELPAGTSSILCLQKKLFHNTFDSRFQPLNAPEIQLENPLAAAAFAWCLVELTEFDFLDNDLWWFSPQRPDRVVLLEQYDQFITATLPVTATPAALRAWLKGRARVVDASQIAWEDPHVSFTSREVLSPMPSPGRLPLEIPPDAWGDQEFHFDLGDQYCGYLEMHLTAPAGTIVDLFLVENIESTGRIQHTGDARNGARYVCREGAQSFHSYVKRSGRHLFVTIRNQSGLVTLSSLVMTESRYPVQTPGTFQCSDPRLNQLYRAAQRTMELSMDDVYLDSLYEQTYWVGDGRTEQLYGLWAFGAQDLSLRSLRLAAQSLERLPMIGAQVPSAWEMILPAWSFLWGIAVWELYEFNGDIAAMRELWPAVRKNLLSAQSYLNEAGLFDAPFWNFFDWAKTDTEHRCTLHNSMLMVGAAQAGAKVAGLLGEKTDQKWLTQMAQRLTQAVQKTFCSVRKAFPDAINAKGQPTGWSVHPQFLAVLFDIAEPSQVPGLLAMLEKPPEGCVDVGSPFMFHFLYEVFDKVGRHDLVLSRMRSDFAAMLDAGATTLWEALPGSLTSPETWPTRSHCHGWSASPLHFLPRSILGIRPRGTGGLNFEIRPHLGDLQFARGSVLTPDGPLHVQVERKEGRFVVSYQAPSDRVGVEILEA